MLKSFKHYKYPMFCSFIWHCIDIVLKCATFWLTSDGRHVIAAL